MSLKVKQDSEDDYLSDYETCGVSRSSDVAGVGSGGGTTRRRRRGIIEKRRRDRINVSLGELRRLVPAALEKSSSTKLEKAEILQMTVDYLKMVHAKGDYVDHTRLAIDYHIIGFRECLQEMSRYLEVAEGMDVHNPVRMRLMSHLQMYSTQKEFGRGGSWSGYPQSAPFCSSPDKANPATGHAQGGFTSSETSGGSMSFTSRSTTVSSSSSYSGQAQTYTNYSPFSSLPIPSPGSVYTPPTVQGKPYRPWGAEMAY